jgi:predicted benzoate:H+ symporter BenE
LDLVRALADDHERRVAEVAFHVVFSGIAVATVDSDGVERDLHRNF